MIDTTKMRSFCANKICPLSLVIDENGIGERRTDNVVSTSRVAQALQTARSTTVDICSTSMQSEEEQKTDPQSAQLSEAQPKPK